VTPVANRTKFYVTITEITKMEILAEDAGDAESMLQDYLEEYDKGENVTQTYNVSECLMDTVPTPIPIN